MAVDSSGNQAVDFVWGNMPLQPNAARTGSGPSVVVGANTAQNHGMSGYSVYPSTHLTIGSYTVNKNNGITEEVKADSHDIADGLWSNYPAFIPNVGYQD
jgi:hypothetical protein